MNNFLKFKINLQAFVLLKDIDFKINILPGNILKYIINV